jgi:site-specific DNA recombinase
MPKNQVSEIKRAAIYCRVSTIDQGKGDFSSLDSQESMLRQFCTSRGWVVYSVYMDMKTGATLERENLTRLMKDAEEGQFDVVVVTKLDRISRSLKDFLELDSRLATLKYRHCCLDPTYRYYLGAWPDAAKPYFNLR